MNVLLLSTYLEGGAGGAALRLHQGLQRKGVTSQVLIQRRLFPKDYGDAVLLARPSRMGQMAGRLRPTLDRLPLAWYAQRSGRFYLNWIPGPVPSRVARLDPDVVNLHWILDGFVRIEALPGLRKPLVWTLHDMWAFTGGCDYSGGCERYRASCGACPLLHSRRSRDLSRWVWRRKAKAWDGLDVTIVTPSTWLASCARSSSLFKDRRIEVIPYGLDTAQFRPIDRSVARDLLRLPHARRLVLFGAWGNHPRKGFHLLEPALRRLSTSAWRDQIEVVVFGFSEPPTKPDLGFKAHYLGLLNDTISLALAYSAADVFVHPSTQDNLPNALIEAMACGTPGVAFHVGGAPDIIEHRQNGYLARPFDVDDLARGIAWVLEDPERHRALAQRAREKAEQEFTLEVQAQRYLDLFHDLVGPDYPAWSPTRERAGIPP